MMRGTCRHGGDWAGVATCQGILDAGGRNRGLILRGAPDERHR
jgi:hypothetical protein